MIDTSLAQVSEVKRLLRTHGLQPRHTLGQNFIVRQDAVAAAVAAAELGPDDTVLEIGPGLGTLTRALASAAERVVAVELDRGLAPVLAETVGGLTNVALIYGDARRVDLADAVAPATGASAKAVANLPYYVTTPLLEALIWSPAVFGRIIVLVQAEAVGRIIARPGDAGYGPLALLTERFYEAQVTLRVSRDAFWPQPHVDSAIVALTRRPAVPDGPPAAPTAADRDLFALIAAAFAQRRKTLVAGLSGNRGATGLPPMERVAVLAAMAEAGLAVTVRGEQMTLCEFQRLHAALARGGAGAVPETDNKAR